MNEEELLKKENEELKKLVADLRKQLWALKYSRTLKSRRDYDMDRDYLSYPEDDRRDE